MIRPQNLFAPQFLAKIFFVEFADNLAVSRHVENHALLIAEEPGGCRLFSGVLYPLRLVVFLSIIHRTWWMFDQI